MAAQILVSATILPFMNAPSEISAPLKGALPPLLPPDVEDFLAGMGNHSALRSDRLKELSMELEGLMWAMVRLPKTASAGSATCHPERRRAVHLTA
ncbi:MAG: hypothetical protein JWO89_1237 [Verrucomicrobiaceae bacterium]|nr:hypothetical protein [Verrucomicrobiaceae bacterium]